MAERGRKSPLDTEVQQAIAAGLAEHLLSGPELDVTPSPRAWSSTSRERSSVTLVSMIALSPDWFVGVAGLALFRTTSGAMRLASISLASTRGPTAGSRTGPLIARRFAGV